MVRLRLPPASLRDVGRAGRPCLLVALTATAVLALFAGPARAASCGGGVPCGCGDTVTADHRLREGLGPCPGHGLVVRSGVRLDCGGLRILGRQDGSDQYGIFLDGKSGAEVTGTTVRNCHVSGFLRGIRLRAARGNTIAANVVTGNGNFTTHEGYGIDVAGGSVENLLEGNRVQKSADEGVHIGRGSHGNRLVGNEITDSHRESLYVLASDHGVFLRNTLGGGRGNSAYIKDSSGNRFEANRFVGRPLRIVGDARDNLFVDNTFSGAAIHFQDYKGTGRPRGNRVTGGAMAGGREYCVRFTNSGGNTVAGLSLSACRVAVRAESPAQATENTILGLTGGTLELDERSTLRIGWRVEVRVQDAAGRPVEGAEVAARDQSGNALWSARTDAAGAVVPQGVATETRTGSSPSRPSSAITLSVRKPGFASHAESLTVRGPLALQVTLKSE